MGGEYIYLLITVTCVFTLFPLPMTIDRISAYSDTDFLESISKQYSSALVERQLQNQIKKRIQTISTIRDGYNLTRDQLAFCNVTLTSLTLFNDYIDSSIPSLQTCGFAVSDRVKYFIQQYEVIVNLFEDEFKSLALPEVEVNYETPDSLLKSVGNRPSSWIKAQTLISIGKYKANVGIFYKEASRYEATLADLTTKQLVLLESEVQSLNLTSSTSKLGPINKSLRITLERFKLIIELFSCAK